ncbi:hypothetical protein JYU34_021081 [Plutella xylostella]|uniref:Uncharacterized protein n=1 Tax=Plutella xylostella TaxID=51655 RepID=A0ABQ7PWE5_PLUXY|nr:hypothetical protein JYU34_021081 [Plutella xylostella]
MSGVAWGCVGLGWWCRRGAGRGRARCVTAAPGTLGRALPPAAAAAAAAAAPPRYLRPLPA